jgi:hypothetical protein
MAHPLIPEFPWFYRLLKIEEYVIEVRHSSLGFDRAFAPSIPQGHHLFYPVCSIGLGLVVRHNLAAKEIAKSDQPASHQTAPCLESPPECTAPLNRSLGGNAPALFPLIQTE